MEKFVHGDSAVVRTAPCLTEWHEAVASLSPGDLILGVTPSEIREGFVIEVLNSFSAAAEGFQSCAVRS